MSNICCFSLSYMTESLGFGLLVEQKQSIFHLSSSDTFVMTRRIQMLKGPFGIRVVMVGCKGWNEPSM